MTMFEASFPSARRIDSEEELRAAFGCDRLNLGAAAEVTFRGIITLAADVAFRGQCQLEDGNTIDQGSILTDVTLGRSNQIRPYSVLTRVQSGDRNVFGPFCFVRDDCRVGDDCILGAHVEAARSTFASGVKISHRAFIGDAELGTETIVGAGVVFCNWDGAGRQPTRVGAGVTLGSGSLLVPPLTIGDAALVGAGSTITRDVPAGARIIQKRLRDQEQR
jgi:bifunctional UDP-N-acetylglucosamine pyrophosphorylase / glucosamine-1-phosphate N-acetyltransferase